MWLLCCKDKGRDSRDQAMEDKDVEIEGKDKDIEGKARVVADKLEGEVDGEVVVIRGDIEVSELDAISLNSTVAGMNCA